GGRLAVEAADRRDAVPANPHVGAVPGVARSVDHAAVPDQQVEHVSLLIFGTSLPPPNPLPHPPGGGGAGGPDWGRPTFPRARALRCTAPRRSLSRPPPSRPDRSRRSPPAPATGRRPGRTPRTRRSRAPPSAAGAWRRPAPGRGA